MNNMENVEDFDLYEYHHKTKYEILLSYKGPFDQDVLSLIADYINIIIGKDPKLSKRMLRIFVELAQNVAYYSSEKNVFLQNEKKTGVGSLTIIETNNKYVLNTGNMVSKDDIDLLIDKCELINSLDSRGLRDLRRKHLDLPDGENDCANIGLIQVAITSANPLKVKVTKCDENNYFFAITVHIDK